MAVLMAGKAAMGSACAPPEGSGMTPSITPKLTSALLVIFSASVACDVQSKKSVSAPRYAGGQPCAVLRVHAAFCRSMVCRTSSKFVARTESIPHCRKIWFQAGSWDSKRHSAEGAQQRQAAHRGSLVARLPQDCCTGLWAGHIVHCMLQNERPAQQCIHV